LKNSIRFGRLLKKHGCEIVSILSTDGVLAFGEVPIKDENDKLSEGQWIKYFELFVSITRKIFSAKLYKRSEVGIVISI
jgi:hypothetical protein